MDERQEINFNKLYAQWKGKVQQRLYLLLSCHRGAERAERAKELSNDVFILFLQTYQPKKGASPKAFLWLVTNRILSNEFRRQNYLKRKGIKVEFDYLHEPYDVDSDIFVERVETEIRDIELKNQILKFAEEWDGDKLSTNKQWQKIRNKKEWLLKKKGHL